MILTVVYTEYSRWENESPQKQFTDLQHNVQTTVTLSLLHKQNTELNLTQLTLLVQNCISRFYLSPLPVDPNFDWSRYGTSKTQKNKFHRGPKQFHLTQPTAGEKF